MQLTGTNQPTTSTPNTLVLRVHCAVPEPPTPHPTRGAPVLTRFNRVTAVTAKGKRPVPYRTRKLSPSAPMVLPWRRGGRVGRRRTTLHRRPTPHGVGLRHIRTPIAELSAGRDRPAVRRTGPRSREVEPWSRGRTAAGRGRTAAGRGRAVVLVLDGVRPAWTVEVVGGAASTIRRSFLADPARHATRRYHHPPRPASLTLSWLARRPRAVSSVAGAVPSCS